VISDYRCFFCFASLFEQTDKKIYFLLMVKCDVIADIPGVKKGDFVAAGNKD